MHTMCSWFHCLYQLFCLFSLLNLHTNVLSINKWKSLTILRIFLWSVSLSCINILHFFGMSKTKRQCNRTGEQGEQCCASYPIKLSYHTPTWAYKQDCWYLQKSEATWLYMLWYHIILLIDHAGHNLFRELCLPWHSVHHLLPTLWKCNNLKDPGHPCEFPDLWQPNALTSVQFITKSGATSLPDISAG